MGLKLLLFDRAENPKNKFVIHCLFHLGVTPNKGNGDIVAKQQQQQAVVRTAQGYR